MKEWREFKIRYVKNGLVIEVRDNYNEEESEEVVYADENADDLEGWAVFLRALTDYYGPQTSRYSPKRVAVRLIPGDKYDGPEPDEHAKKEFESWMKFRLEKAEPTIEEAFVAGFHSGQHDLG